MAKNKYAKIFGDERDGAREALFRLKDLTNMSTVMTLLKKHGGYSITTLPTKNIKAFTDDALKMISEKEEKNA